MKKTYSVLVLIAAIILIVYRLVPKQTFEEFIFPHAEDVSVIYYDDKADGGSSDAFMTLDSTLNFSCTLGSDTTKGAWCGLLFDFTEQGEGPYRNWTFIDSLVFEVEVQGTRELLVKVWAYDPDVTNEEKKETFRLLMKELPLKKGVQRVAIPLDHFYIPDWWYERTKTDKSLNRRHQESIARFELAPGWNQERGKNFALKFKSIKAVGISNVPFGIVLCSFLILTIVAIGRKHQLKNEKK